jgi:hypothetical protein
MNLRGPVGKLQKSASRFYVQLAQRFIENPLIRDAWSLMAQDLEQQSASLKTLRPSFWKELKKQEKSLQRAIADSYRLLANRHDAVSLLPLHDCFVRTLEFEEPITLNVYLPLMLELRSHWTEPALDFYILVNAHITRIARLIQSVSGDPALIQRCGALLQKFEKESQAPELVPVVISARKKKPRKAVRRLAVSLRKSRNVRRRLAAVKRAAKPLPKGRKPLLKNIKIARGRVRR